MSEAHRSEEKIAMDHIEAAPIGDDEKWRDVRADADKDEDFQHSLSLWQSIRVYKAAAFWSITASFCIIMEGYDTLLLGSLLALPAFKEKFGHYAGKKSGYQLTAPWQAGLQQGANVGSFFGVLLGAFLVDRLGYKRTVCGGLAFIIPIIALITFAPNKPALLLGEMLAGLPWGIFSTLAVAYASEVAPVNFRPYLTTYVNLCWVMGHLVGAGILRKAAAMTGVWSYRMPFAVQWAWPVPLLALLLFAPESPWWLVRHGKLEEAERSVRRLAPGAEIDQAKSTVANMVRVNELERETIVKSSFIDCFKGIDLRRTEISVVSWTIQILCGLQFANYSTYFFEQAGLSTVYAFDMTIGLYAAAFIGTCSSWFLLTFFGRRTIFVTGLFCLATGQLIIGGLSVVASNGHVGARWGQAGLMVVWLFIYDLTVGPLAYAIVGEASSTRLRNKTVALSRASYNIFSVSFGVLMPYMLNPTAWGWGGKIGFFWGPICFLCWIWAYFRLPEMKGRSYYELDVLFERRTPARKFATAVVERDADLHDREAR